MYNIFNEDCISGMKKLADNSIDFICTDLPYNLTDCAWDKNVIDLPTMWAELKRILKPYSVAALFASGKFAHKLIASNFDWYKYKWIWVKNAPTNFVHAKNAPMRKFEEILVFSDGVVNHKTVSKKRMKYNPQGIMPCEPFIKSGANATKMQIHNPHPENTYIQTATNYPSDVLEFKTVPTTKRFHPTQKPTDLLEYLIKTYSNEGETVLDATCGSGSTGVAAINTGRRFIGFELEKKFYDIAEKRISEAVNEKAQSLFKLEA